MPTSFAPAGIYSPAAAAGGGGGGENDDNTGLTDPYIANVPYLFHFEGTNASALTTTVNSSPSISDTFVINFNGTATHSTTRARFGSTSAWLQAAYAITVANSRFAWGTADYTIQFSLWIDSQQTTKNVMFCGGLGNSQNGVFYLMADGTLRLYQNAADKIVIPGITTGAWNDVCFCRVGGTTRGFLGGTLVSSVGSDTANWNEAGGLWLSYSSSAFTGFIDEIRVTSGVGRFTSNYTVRTTAYPNS